MQKLLNLAFALAATSILAVQSAKASVINFDDQGLTGPSFFASTTPQDLSLTIDGVGVSIKGGGVLTNASFLPGNTSSVYGTADFFPGGLNPITITFSSAITNFFLDVFNGNTKDVSYQVFDNNGNSTTVTLPNNISGGFTTVGFAATGTMVSILGLDPGPGACCGFDFFIDNIHFNEPLPPSSVPLPAALPLLLSGIGALGAAGWRNRRKPA